MDSLDTVSFCIAQLEFELVEILLSHHMEGWFYRYESHTHEYLYYILFSSSLFQLFLNCLVIPFLLLALGMNIFLFLWRKCDSISVESGCRFHRDLRLKTKSMALTFFFTPGWGDHWPFSSMQRPLRLAERGMSDVKPFHAPTPQVPSTLRWCSSSSGFPGFCAGLLCKEHWWNLRFDKRMSSDRSAYVTPA